MPVGTHFKAGLPESIGNRAQLFEEELEAINGFNNWELFATPFRKLPSRRVDERNFHGLRSSVLLIAVVDAQAQCIAAPREIFEHPRRIGLLRLGVGGISPHRHYVP